MQDYYFNLLSKDQPGFSLSVQALIETLDPIYGVGSTDKLIDKLLHNNDRICDVYYEKGEPRGLIIFKNFLSDEYNLYGIYKGCEIKTILLMVPQDKSVRLAMRKKIMQRLLHRVAYHGMHMQAESLFGTVAQGREGTLNLVLRMGVEIAHTFKDKFKEGKEEYLIVHKNIEKFYELTKD